MNFTYSSTALTKTFLRGWSLWVWWNATLLKQMPCLLKTQAAIISRHCGGLATVRTIRRYTVEINPMLLCQWVHNSLPSNGFTQELLQQALLDRVTNARLSLHVCPLSIITLCITILHKRCFPAIAKEGKGVHQWGITYPKGKRKFHAATVLSFYIPQEERSPGINRSSMFFKHSRPNTLLNTVRTDHISDGHIPALIQNTVTGGSNRRPPPPPLAPEWWQQMLHKTGSKSVIAVN